MASGSKLVSVIMPCFNAGPMLRPALRSVLDQTYPHLEIIFVDNNSTDDSRSIAEGIAQEASRPIRIVDCPQQGVNHARNLGFGFAGGDYIQWMDADDRLDPDKIALQIAALDTNPETNRLGDWTSHWSEPSRPPRSRRHNLAQNDDQVRRTLAGMWYPPHLYLLRRKAAQALQDADGWWPGRPVGTDVEYSAVAALMGLRFRHVPGAHVHYNIWSNGQISEGTPYDLRVRTLGEIFNRLEQMVTAAKRRFASAGATSFCSSRPGISSACHATPLR